MIELHMNDEVKRCAQKPSQYVNDIPLKAPRKTMKNVRTDGLRVEIWIRDRPNSNQHYYTLHLTFGCELQRIVQNFITSYHIAATRNISQLQHVHVCKHIRNFTAERHWVCLMFIQMQIWGNRASRMKVQCYCRHITRILLLVVMVMV